jgi:gamma-glutamylcyclotransferase
MSEHVFAYGSNMCSTRLREYGVSPDGPGRPACLVGYRLNFNKKSRDGSGKANLEPDPVAEVWGVLYLVPAAQLRSLDRGEGSGYERQCMVVRTSSGEEVNAWVYVALQFSAMQALRPYEWYKHLLVEGAREHILPGSYLESLEAIDAVPDPHKERAAKRSRIQCRGAG